MKEDSDKPIDLSSMINFEIEPSWVKGKQNSNTYSKVTGKNKSEGRQRKSKEKFRGNSNQNKRINERKKIDEYDFQILPKIQVLDKIKSEMRKTGVSYALSDICKTISCKKERIDIKIRFKNNEEKNFIKTKIDQRIFTSADEAVDHLLKNCFEQCFVKALDSEEKPSKNFEYAFKCNKTKLLLPPNNYHRHEEMVRQHMFLNGISESPKKYLDNLEKIHDQDEIKSWLAKPLEIFKFKFLNEKNKWYKGIDQLKTKLLNDLPVEFFQKEKIIKINGSDLNNLDTTINEQFNRYLNFKSNWINQLFTSCLVNLKKSNFFIFKYSEKKNTYACAFKHNLIEGKQLTQRVQKIVEVLKAENDNKISKILKHDALKHLEPKTILIELKWLVKEGYITEFANGTVSAN